MKTLRISFLSILLLASLCSFSRNDTIFAVVTGDTVTIWQTEAWRNCGAVYEMIIEGSDHHLSWIQSDTGDAAFCLCYFDLSVSFQVPEPGHYEVDVYYTESIDPVLLFYAGSTSFDVGGAARSGEIISYYQSECYSGVGVAEPASLVGKNLNIYPVPARFDEHINIEFNSAKKGAVLEILTMTGKRLFSKRYTENQFIQDQLRVAELVPASGIYLVRITVGDEILVNKVPILK